MDDVTGDLNPLVEQLRRAQAFAKLHGPACAQELLTRNTTGVLPFEGRMVDLRRLCSWAEPHALQVAEKLVSDVALDALANQRTPVPYDGRDTE